MNKAAQISSLLGLKTHHITICSNRSAGFYFLPGTLPQDKTGVQSRSSIYKLSATTTSKSTADCTNLVTGIIFSPLYSSETLKWLSLQATIMLEHLINLIDDRPLYGKYTVMQCLLLAASVWLQLTSEPPPPASKWDQHLFRGGLHSRIYSS